jgi:hypothetical protein
MIGYDIGSSTVEWCQCYRHQHDGDQQSFGMCLICGCPTDKVQPPRPPWKPPPPQVSFITNSHRTLFRHRVRYVAYVNTVNVWAMQSQPHFGGWTEKEALDKAIKDAKKRFPEEMANTPDPPRISHVAWLD